MSDLIPGQVLTLRISIPYHGAFVHKHPYLILKVFNEYVEVGQLHSLEGKMFEAISIKNKVIYASLPDETVIDKDSYIEKNNRIMIENFPELVNYRRQTDRLSAQKLEDVLDAYDEYQSKNIIDESRISYMSMKDIEDMN